MRRQYNHSSRDPSRDLKTLSKAKKTKHSHMPSNQQRKTDLQNFKNIQVNQLKSKTQYQIKEKTTSRVLQKINLISRLVSKLIDKKQRQKVTELVTLIQKEENIRNQLENQDDEKSKHQIKQLKDSLNRLLQKQDDIVKNASYSNTLTQTMGNASGLQKMGLIGIQTSPKMKNDILAVFEKRSQQFGQIKILQETIMKKDQTINELFKKIEKLSDRKVKFSQLYSSISRKIENYEKFQEEIDHLSFNVEEQKQKMDHFISQNNQLRHQNNKLQEEIKMANKEKDRNKKKQQEISQQFQILVGEKLKLQYQLTKKADEFCCLNENNLNRLSTIINCKTQLQQLIKDQIQRAKKVQQSLRTYIQQQFKIFWSENKQIFEQIIGKYQLKVKSSEQKLIQSYQTIEQFKKEKKQVENHRFRLLEEKMIQGKEMETLKNQNIYKRQKFKINSKMFQMRFHQQKSINLTINNFQFFTHVCEQMKYKDAQVSKKTSQLSFERYDILLYKGEQKQINSNETQTQFQQFESKIIENTDSFTQTIQLISQDKDIQTNFNSINDTQSQTERKLFSFASKVNEWTVLHEQQIKLSINKTVHISHFEQITNVQNGIQTEDFDPDLQYQLEDLPSTTKKLTPSISDEQSGNQILRMLQEAEQCFSVPEIQLLKFQMQTYRQQIEMLNMKIRQLQKDKEDESEFNFRL